MQSVSAEYCRGKGGRWEFDKEVMFTWRWWEQKVKMSVCTVQPSRTREYNN